MAQPTHLDRNLPDLGGPFLYRDQDQGGENAPYSLETPYGFQLDLDFLKYVEDIEKGQTLRKLTRHRKAKGPKLGSLSSSRGQTGGWTSTESLSSTTSEDGKPTFSPRPRLWAGSSDIKEPACKPGSLPTSPAPTIQLLPPPLPKSLVRNTRVEKTLLETSKRLEREQWELMAGGTSPAPEMPASPSKTHAFAPYCFSGWGDNQAGPSLPPAGSVKISPSNSGRSTPATALSPAHLHHVREQMAAALRRLKELEEQVKTIPVLEGTICRLEKEKEELVAGLWEKLESEAGEAPEVFHFPPKSPNTGPTRTMGAEGSQSGRTTDVEASQGRLSKIAELKKLTEKLSGSDRATKAGRGAARPGKGDEPTRRSVGTGEEVDMQEVVFYYRSQRPHREVGVGRETETRDAEVWVMESLLGVSSEAEKEIQLLQQTAQHHREVIAMLEGHLKEATDELEELRVEVCSRMPRNLVSKETTARPETVEACVEAVPDVRSRAVGGHVETAEKSVHCSPHVAGVGVGCDLPREDLASVCRGDKATQVDLEKGREAPRTEVDSVAAEPGHGTEDANVGKPEGSKEPSLQVEVSEFDPESRLLPQPTRKDVIVLERESEKGATGVAGTLKSIMKKQDGPAKLETGSRRKTLQFVGVLNGEYESTSSEEEEEEEEEEEGSPGKGSPRSSDSDVAGSTDVSDEDSAAHLDRSAPDLESPIPGNAKPGPDPEEAEDTECPGVAASEVKEKFELSHWMRDACLVVRSQLGRGGGPASKSKEVLSSTGLVLQEWFRVSSQKASLANEVADHLLAFGELSPALLAHVVNLSDGNGNTALHYSVSHSNFDIVRLLLDTEVCNVNHQNKAGYTALMLAALAAVEQEDGMAVVRRLFGLGNVNAKASQAGQTALMLAVSHGRQEMVEALLACGADINLQDEEGSTALMCACEHGRTGTVRLLLSQPACNVSVVDHDGNDAVSIALEAGHRDIAALISTHLTQSMACIPEANGKTPSRDKRPL
ncbi:KN motif and ankyrin repeat domain-containing protein 3 [Elgaria multicarinata webbii]|uniref:KN motif and ankyrin repeat domain-containing protein 3 n=1 Tax=Elgaria multicarinata webbii TaxID=159646 RepID=UPI002FCCC192